MRGQSKSGSSVTLIDMAAMDGNLNAERRRLALRAFMASRELKVKPWCERAGVHPNILYNFLKGRSNSLSQQTLELLASFESVTISTLIGDTPLSPGKIRSVCVLGDVQAGAWVEAMEWLPEHRYNIEIPLEKEFAQSAFGLEVKGDSMNQEYTAGTIVVCVNIHDAPGGLRPGDHVIVQRMSKDGTIEATVKELAVENDGRAWLWPRSTSPDHQQPIEIPWPHIKEGADDTTGIDISVVAVVIGSYKARRRNNI